MPRCCCALLIFVAGCASAVKPVALLQDYHAVKVGDRVVVRGEVDPVDSCSVILKLRDVEGGGWKPGAAILDINVRGFLISKESNVAVEGILVNKWLVGGIMRTLVMEKCVIR